MADDESFDLSGELDDFLNEDSSPALDLDAGLMGDSGSVSGFDPLEAELDAPIESSADLIEDADDLVEDSGLVEASGLVEEETAGESAVIAPAAKRRGFFSSFSIFDAMLVCSLILVTAAALMMAYGLNDYGSVFGLPWKTTGITVK